MLLSCVGAGLALSADDTHSTRQTWMSDNGNGTFTNPLFYDEFSDPDLIRVDDDYYMTGTTMHTMPGLPVLHSRDLVNWDFLSYAAERLDIGPESRLEDGKDFYGQGFWAPCLRYHDGRFFIFSNVNRNTTHIYTSTNPSGPWTHRQMKRSLHDLSVLFDDDGKVYVVWGYEEIRMGELDDDLTDLRPGTERVIIPRGSGAGEGSHFSKIKGKYYICMAQWNPVCYQVCARSDSPWGPYEIIVMSAEENFGIGTGWRLPYSSADQQFRIVPPQSHVGCVTLHQGGVVQTQTGEWWGFSMMDHNSVGRVTCLVPVTWDRGWPYYGLPGNLTRAPLTWVKPNTGVMSEPHAPYDRSDDFSGPGLNPVWQWNHVPVDSMWSLSERSGSLSLHALPAPDFWHARNSLTQRAIGPESIATTELHADSLRDGDRAGIALLNYPYAWIAITRDSSGFRCEQYDQRTDRRIRIGLASPHIWFRAHCNFDAENASLSYSVDSKTFTTVGEPVILAYQLKTFQGVRYALFNYTVRDGGGGSAAFERFDVHEPRPSGLTRPIPYNETIVLTSLADSSVLVNWGNAVRPVAAGSRFAGGEAAHFVVVDGGKGRIALRSAATGGFVTVSGLGTMGEVRIEGNGPGEAAMFQWEDMQRGDLMLLSLKTHRYLHVDPHAGSLCSADARGTNPERTDGSCFVWSLVKRATSNSQE